MAIARAALIFTISLGFLACTKHEAEHENTGEPSVEEFRSSGVDLKLPSELWDLIEEKKIVDHGHIIQKPETDTAQVPAENIFSPIEVAMSDLSPGVLRTHSHLLTGRVGLNVDLANYIKADTGSFLLKITPDFEMDPAKTKVYFVSRAKKRKVDGQIFGSGCNKFLDITDYYFKEIKEHGLKVNVYRARQASLLQGHFIFTSGEDLGVRLLTQVSFTDSRFPQYRCDGE